MAIWLKNTYKFIETLNTFFVRFFYFIGRQQLDAMIGKTKQIRILHEYGH